MTMLTIWIQTGDISNEDIAQGLIDHDVAVVNFGWPTKADQRTKAIRNLLDDSGESVIRIRLIFGPGGERCTHQTSDLNDDRRYNEFDVLFAPANMDMDALYAGLAMLIAEWRRRGQPSYHTVTVPHVSPFADDHE